MALLSFCSPLLSVCCFNILILSAAKWYLIIMGLPCQSDGTFCPFYHLGRLSPKTDFIETCPLELEPQQDIWTGKPQKSITWVLEVNILWFCFCWIVSPCKVCILGPIYHPIMTLLASCKPFCLQTNFLSNILTRSVVCNDGKSINLPRSDVKNLLSVGMKNYFSIINVPSPADWLLLCWYFGQIGGPHF